jgi:geranylgeranyl reductase family protein
VSGSFDAVVVGAGPAGSVAALVLARGGAKVALVDKASFPRDKACGDLIGPRGVQVLGDLGVQVPDAGQGADLLAVGPTGRRSRLPAFAGRTYPGHGIVVPRLELDHALREAALAAGAVGVQARITGVERGPDGTVRAVLAGDGRRLAGGVIIGADGALSPVARLAGMLDEGSALWGFAIRAYVPAEVPLPLLVLLDSSPWRIYPGYGWLFPGADGRANVGIGVGMGASRRQAPLRGDLARLCGLLSQRGDLGRGASHGPVIGGWLRMGGTGTPPAAANVLLVGDAAGLINPLQGEGIGPAMVSARLAAEAVLATAGIRLGAFEEGLVAEAVLAASGEGLAAEAVPADAGEGLAAAGEGFAASGDAPAVPGAGPAAFGAAEPVGLSAAGRAYTRALAAGLGRYLPGAVALQRALLRRPHVASAGMRLLTAPVMRRLIAGTWSIYWNGLADGASPRPSAFAARAVQGVASWLPGAEDPR